MEKAWRLKIGDPMERGTNIGPMARGNLHDQVQRSVAEGAELKLGGAPVEGEGFHYPPTVLDHVKPGMVAFVEETFGPVAAIIRARDADEAIAMANDSEYGFGCALWAGDVARARNLARRIDAGAIVVTVVTMTAWGYFTARLVKLYPVESAIVASTHSGMGGAGNIAILSASNRMMLMPLPRSPPGSGRHHRGPGADPDGDADLRAGAARVVAPGLCQPAMVAMSMTKRYFTSPASIRS